jgi:hypothetical protein
MFVRLTDNEPEITVPENPPGTERLLVEAENVDQTTLEKCQILESGMRAPDGLGPKCSVWALQRTPEYVLF